MSQAHPSLMHDGAVVSSDHEEEEKHAHLGMQLSCSNQIRYIHVRRFGRFLYI